MTLYPVSLRYALHPYLKERAGYRRLLRLTKPDLAEVLRLTDPYTLISGINRTTLVREGLRVLENGIDGDFIEVGVHKGGSAAVMARLLDDHPQGAARTLHLFDRWGDLPETTEKDGFRAEEYRKSNIPEKLRALQEVPPKEKTVEILSKIGFDRARLWTGWYDETFPHYDGGKIAFAHVDCDYYESVAETLKFIEGRLAPGATIIVDDYGSWPGAKLALEEWLAQTTLKTKMFVLPSGPAVVRTLIRD